MELLEGQKTDEQQLDGVQRLEKASPKLQRADGRTNKGWAMERDGNASFLGNNDAL